MLVPPLLRQNRQFRRFWAAEGASLLGDQISLIALPLVAVLALDATAAEMGYLVAAALAPNLFFLLARRRVGRPARTAAADDDRRRPRPGGPDRLDPARLRVRRAHLRPAARRGLPRGSLAVLFQVSHSTLFVSLVPREQFVEAGSILNGTRALSFVGGPSIGGVLVQLSSSRSSSSTRPAPSTCPRGALGLVLGAGAIGGVIGSLVTGALSRRIGIGPAFVLGCVVFPAPLLLVPLAQGPKPMILALLFLA